MVDIDPRKVKGSVVVSGMPSHPDVLPQQGQVHLQQAVTFLRSMHHFQMMTY